MLGKTRKNGQPTSNSEVLYKFFPFIFWFRAYDSTKLRQDFISGLTVALVLVPQSMAYAQLAGLPAYYGLYAAFLPPLIASLFGSSHQLATGPVAIVSLMTATALAPLATAGSEAFFAYAILLAFLVGIFQLALGVLKLGLVINFLSHPVVNGFTNAAALIIASSQLSKLFGVTVDSAEHHYETIYYVIKAAISYTHWPTLAIALLAFLIMITLKRLTPKIPNVLVAVIITSIISWALGFEHNRKATLDAIENNQAQVMIANFNQAIANVEAKSEERVELATELREIEDTYGDRSVKALEIRHKMSLLTVEITELKEATHELRENIRLLHFKGIEDPNGHLRFYAIDDTSTDRPDDGRNWRIKVGNSAIKADAVSLTGGGSVVGDVPKGLPGLNLPKFDLNTMLSLFPMAIIISLLGFMEAISIAKAMAARTGQRLDPNQELVGQGLANIIGSVFHSYAVSGSFSRSAVNIQSGAVTGLSNVFSSCVVAATLLFLTPLLYYLPQAVLAAIIMMAVIGLLNVRGFIHAWKAQKYDGAIGIITFIATLAFAPHLDRGIMIGVGLSLGLQLLRSMKPDMALLSLHPDGTFRNQKRFHLKQCRHIALIRYNGSLYFANVSYLEEQILELISGMPELRHIIIVGNGINEMDASGEDMLSILVSRIREAGYDISFSGLNDDVLDVLRRTHLYEKIGEDHLYRNATRAIDGVYAITHAGSGESPCPLRSVVAVGLPTIFSEDGGEKLF